MNLARTISFRIDDATDLRVKALVSACQLKPAELLRIGLLRVLAEYEASGGLTLGKPAPTPRKRKAIPA